MYIDWKKRKVMAVIFISGLFSLVSVAQERDTVLERRIDEVTVSANRMPRQLSATVPVQAISGEKIKTLGLQNIADAVRRFAGATVRDYGGIGGMKTLSVRSLGAHHTAVRTFPCFRFLSGRRKRYCARRVWKHLLPY